LLFARLGTLEGDRGPIAPVVFAAEVAQAFPHGELLVRGPMVSARKGYHKPILDRAVKLGHQEIWVDGELKPPSPRPRLRRNTLHTIAYIVGRVDVNDRASLVRHIEDAVLLTQGPVEVGPEGGPVLRAEVTVDEAVVRRRTWDPRLFSHHTEVGACVVCGGHGHVEQVSCSACDGTGLGAQGRTILFGKKTLPELLAMTPQALVSFLQALQLGSREALIAKGPIQAIVERATFLLEVGLGYLTLNRKVRTLSGGEAQRIRLAAQLGAHLSGVLYVLDEPTIGLHPTDTDRLLVTLDRLQARGNGVLMVEHDEATLRSADILVDMGPGAGVEGGEILVQGPLADVLADPKSITGRCLRDGMEVVRTKPRSLKGASYVSLRGMRHHNLRDVNVRIPRGRLTVVTGVSGSGKSSLVDVLRAAMTGEGLDATGAAVTGLKGLKRFIEVDDKPIGKNPRSTPATYVGVWDTIRGLFAKLPESRLRGYGPGRFSFNVKGGRCEACGGQGVVKLEMSFLPDAYSLCEVCGGRRWNGQTLHIRYDQHTIHDVLQMPVRDALTLFERVPKIKRALSLLSDVGLGYLELGQASPTLSGGEAQRIKLARELLGRDRADTVVVLDEPSVGLHMADVPSLLRVIHRLVDAGATVVVIEHHPDVMREADWIIDMGPGAGDEGGQVVYQGRYPGLLSCEKSRTGTWLAGSDG
jgi:excinuclease ABC subunit A